jgi:methyl-accepting chemotaxis protein
MSTGYDRLLAVYDAYSKAYDRRLDDWSKASSSAQAKAIADNVDALETHYLRAAKQALDANSAAVEAAFEAATRAQEKIDEAYKNSKSIAEKIRLVGEVVGKIGDLIDTARGS